LARVNPNCLITGNGRTGVRKNVGLGEKRGRGPFLAKVGEEGGKSLREKVGHIRKGNLEGRGHEGRREDIRL